MATHTQSGNGNTGRTFSISRENGQANKDGKPYFFEFLTAEPEAGNGRKFETRRKEGGEAKHYELFQALSGYLTGITTEEKTFGGTKDAETHLILTMVDEGETYTIEPGKVDGRYSLDVMKRLLDPAFNPLETLRLSPYAFEGSDGKQVIGLSAISGVDGKLIAKRDAPHLEGVPRATNTEFQGKTLWDFTPIARWLYAKVQKEVLPSLGGAAEPINANVTANHEPVTDVTHSDDLPF